MTSFHIFSLCSHNCVHFIRHNNGLLILHQQSFQLSKAFAATICLQMIAAALWIEKQSLLSMIYD